MSAYGSVTFLVVGNGGQFPTVEADSDGFNRYKATIRLASLGDRNTLAGLLSIVTPLRIYGRLGGNIHIEGGPGAATLVVPAATSSTISRSAVLVALTTIGADGHDHRHRFTAAAEWIIVT
jgi:hypothetical protein